LAEECGGWHGADQLHQLGFVDAEPDRFGNGDPGALFRVAFCPPQFRDQLAACFFSTPTTAGLASGSCASSMAAGRQGRWKTVVLAAQHTSSFWGNYFLMESLDCELNAGDTVVEIIA